MEDKKYVEVDLGGMFRKLIREKRTLLRWCIVAFVIGLVIALSVPKTFKSTAKMAPETAGSSSGGALSSLAGIAGINLGSMMSSSDSVPTDLYPDIVSSSPFIVELFSIPVNFKRGNEAVSVDYYTYLKKYFKRAWWEKLMGLPGSLIGWARNLFSSNKDRGTKEAVSDLGPVDPANLTIEQMAIADMVRMNMELGIDKKSSMIFLTVKAQDPEVAQLLCEKVITCLQTYVANYRTKKARQDLEYYEQLYEEARTNYYAAQQRYADHVDRHQGIISQRAKTDQDRLQNEMSLKYQLYNACAQQVQAAKAKVQQDTPAFTVIEPPQKPFIGKPSRPLVLFVVVFLGFLLSILWILWLRDAIASLRKEDEEKESAADAAPKEEDAQA